MAPRDITGNAADHAATGGPDAHDHLHQDVLNELPIPPRRLQHDCLVRVHARLVWEDDGLEVIATTAFAWFGRKVMVEVLDRRRRIHGVWLHTSDVRRRATDSPGRKTTVRPAASAGRP